MQWQKMGRDLGELAAVKILRSWGMRQSSSEQKNMIPLSQDGIENSSFPQY